MQSRVPGQVVEVVCLFSGRVQESWWEESLTSVCLDGVPFSVLCPGENCCVKVFVVAVEGSDMLWEMSPHVLHMPEFVISCFATYVRKSVAAVFHMPPVAC